MTACIVGWSHARFSKLEDPDAGLQSRLMATPCSISRRMQRC